MEKKNKLFDSMTPAQRRVAIAKDALSIIRLKNIKVKQGFYLESKFLDNMCRKDDTAVCDIDSMLKSNCKVCARGALLLSSVKIFNSASYGDLSTCGSNNDDNVAFESFSKEQLLLIEWVFEGWYHKDDRIHKWKEKYPVPHDRLVAILKNIIRNKGTFKINQL
jgi:hypothetical protein